MNLGATTQVFQVLEGSARDVMEIWKKIQADPRHENITVIKQQCSHRRRYAGFPMLWLSEDLPKSATRGLSKSAVDVVCRVKYESVMRNPDPDGALREVEEIVAKAQVQSNQHGVCLLTW